VSVIAAGGVVASGSGRGVRVGCSDAVVAGGTAVGGRGRDGGGLLRGGLAGGQRDRDEQPTAAKHSLETHGVPPWAKRYG